MPESWHLRYIGKEAQDIADSGLSLKNTMASPVAITLINKKSAGADIPTFYYMFLETYPVLLIF